MDHRIPAFDNQRGRRHSNYDSAKLRSTVEVDIRRVTDMALELIRSEPISACFNHHDWLKVYVAAWVRSHENNATARL